MAGRSAGEHLARREAGGRGIGLQEKWRKAQSAVSYLYGS